MKKNNMKRYIFCEAWSQYKTNLLEVYEGKTKNKKTFKECLIRVIVLAKKLKDAGFDFDNAWCNKKSTHFSYYQRLLWETKQIAKIKQQEKPIQ